MASSSQNRNPDQRYEFGRDNNPTVSQLVRPSDNIENRDNPYTGDSRRNRVGDYESMKRGNDDQRNNRSDQGRYVPTANIVIDPTRRGNSRTCVMEINIAVSTGGGRAPQASYTTNNYPSNTPPIRSQTVIDDVHYLDINFQAPENTAKVSTDGLIRRSPSTGFSKENTKH